MRCDEAKDEDLTDGMRANQDLVVAELAAPLLAEQAKKFEAEIKELKMANQDLEAKVAAASAESRVIAMLPLESGDAKAAVEEKKKQANKSRKRRRNEADLLFDQLKAKELAGLGQRGVQKGKVEEDVGRPAKKAKKGAERG